LRLSALTVRRVYSRCPHPYISRASPIEDHQELPMRAEAEKLAEAIRQSLALLRRHL
jgi:hypothetical protein